MRRSMNFLTAFIVSFLLPAIEFKFVHGRFTTTACYWDNCVQQNTQGRWCYSPDPEMSGTAITCNGDYRRDVTMAAVVAVHIKQGLSVAYYSGVDNAFLGGADFPFPASGGIIRLCASGKAGDGSLQTLCSNVHADNVVNVPGSGDPVCIVAVGQTNVTDGCYSPEPTPVPVATTLVAVNPSSGTTSQALSPVTPTTTLGAAITSTITGNGPKQTVVVDKNGNSSSSSSSSSGPSRVILPLALTASGLLLISVGVGAWFLRKRMRRERESLPPSDKEVPVLESPPDSLRGDGRA